MITHLDPDILELEVKEALGSITVNKASEVMEFHLSYLKSWKMMLWKGCTQYASKIGKLSSGHRTRKDQFSFHSQRKAMPKNGQDQIRLDQLLSCVRLFATRWTPARQASLSITNSWSSLRLTSTELVMPSSHLILCHPLLLLPPIPPSMTVISSESTLCMR